MIIFKFLEEMIDQLVASVLTCLIILLFVWPFMGSGFGAAIMKPLALLSIAGLFWVFLPIITGTVKAAYLDWRKGSEKQI